MQYIDKSLLHLHQLHNYIYYDIKRKWAEVYEDEIRAMIAGSSHLSAVPHLKEQLAPDRPLWEILALVDLYEETLQPAQEARDAAAEVLVAEEIPALRGEYTQAGLDFYSLYPMPGGESAYVTLPISFAQSARLVLQGLSMTGPLELEDPIWWELTRQGSGYRLTFFTEAFETLELDFDGLAFQRQFYHAGSCCGQVDNPWMLLCEMAGAIVEKHRADPALLNEQESHLLPLLYALHGLEYPAPERAEEVGFAPLLEQLQAHGLTKAAKALQEFSTAPEKKRNGRYNKLLVCLRQKECESLWRQLHQAIWTSQDGLPFATQEDGEALEPQRQEVTRTLHAMGFQGDYPFFWQEGPKKGVTLLKSYEQDYFVGMEKHGFYLVQAFEAPILGQSGIYFVAGTVFIKEKDYTPGMCPDIYAAMFEDKGRRCFQNVLTLFSDLTPAQAAVIAAKKARLEKLTKEERKSLVQFPVAMVWVLALFMGLFFGVAFTLLFGLFVAGILLIGGEPAAIWDFPWLFCFLFSTIGFGGCMGIVMLLQAQK